MSAEAWPKAVLDAAQRRELVIFVGAGVSRASTNEAGDRPPSWSQLLTSVTSSVRPTAAEQKIVNDFIDRELLLEAAEYLHALADDRFLLNDLREAIALATDGPNGDNFGGNEWHDAIMALEPRIIVTTNYDKIIERASRNGYRVSDFESPEVGEKVRLGDPVLLKIHGTVDTKSKMVLTQTDYSNLHLGGRHALQVLQGLMLTKTCLFLGYSLSDPDIRLLLQNIRTSTEGGPAHYLLTSAIEPFRKRFFSSAFGVGAIQYPHGKHVEGLQLLQQLGALEPIED